MIEVEVVVVVLWLQFLCFKMLAVMTVFRPIQITSVERLNRKGTEKVVTAVVVMTERPADVIMRLLAKPTLKTKGRLEEVGINQIVIMTLLTRPTLKIKGRLEEVGIEKVVTAVVVVTKKTAVVVVTVV